MPSHISWPKLIAHLFFFGGAGALLLAQFLSIEIVFWIWLLFAVGVVIQHTSDPQSISEFLEMKQLALQEHLESIRYEETYQQSWKKKMEEASPGSPSFEESKAQLQVVNKRIHHLKEYAEKIRNEIAKMKSMLD
ncbi:MAG: hypothetical protein AB8F95_06800 [Bacteroidia bacterium]